jgi:hypothetical protein
VTSAAAYWDCVCLYSYTSLAVICCLARSFSRRRGLFGGYRSVHVRRRYFQLRKGLLKFAIARLKSNQSSGLFEFYFLVYLARKLKPLLRYLSLNPSQVLQENFQIRFHSMLLRMQAQVLH